VTCFFYLGVDRYPPFSGADDGSYPVRVHIAPPLPQYSRLKVLFRMIYAILAMVIRYAMSIIIGFVSVLSWITIVITGRQPESLQNALNFALAYTTRADALLFLLTETYPPFDEQASLVTARAEGTEKVPAVSGDVQEDCNLPVLLYARRGDELDAVLAHALIRGLEIIDAKEHADATGELLADGLRLPLAVRPREQNRSACLRRPDHHPPLGPAVVRGRRRILDQLKAELLDEELDRDVVVVDDQRDLFQMHGRSAGAGADGCRVAPLQDEIVRHGTHFTTSSDHRQSEAGDR
jgi:hypothetical protein